MKQHDNNESSIQNESLTDLPLTGEQADETRAGHAAGGGQGAGKVQMRDFDLIFLR